MATEVLKGFSPGVFNRLYATHNKNLEQRKYRTKEQANNISRLTLKATTVNSNI